MKTARTIVAWALLTSIGWGLTAISERFSTLYECDETV